MISTAGSGPDTSLGLLRTRALGLRSVKRHGALVDCEGPDLRALLWEVPPEAPLTVREIRKANPAPWLTDAGLKEQQRRLAERDFRRFVCNRWISDVSSWLPAGAWQSCAGETPFEDGEKVWAALDVGGTEANTALVWVNAALRDSPAALRVGSPYRAAADVLRVFPATGAAIGTFSCPTRLASRGLLVGRSARKRFEEAAELLHRVVVQQASVADPCNSELGELGVRRGWWDLEDIDRPRSVRDKALQGVRLPEEDWEYAVGAGLCVGVRPLQRFAYELGLSLRLGSGKESGDEDVDPGVDHESIPLVGRRPANRAQPVGLFGPVAQLAGGVIGVLEVAAGRPHRLQPGHEIGRLHPIAGLGIDRHWDVDSCGDPRGGSEHLVAGRPLVILIAERGGYPAARRRNHGESRRHHGPRRGGVPGVRKDERGAGHVQ